MTNENNAPRQETPTDADQLFAAYERCKALVLPMDHPSFDFGDPFREANELARSMGFENYGAIWTAIMALATDPGSDLPGGC